MLTRFRGSPCFQRAPDRRKSRKPPLACVLAALGGWPRCPGAGWASHALPWCGPQILRGGFAGSTGPARKVPAHRNPFQQLQLGVSVGGLETARGASPPCSEPVRAPHPASRQAGGSPHWVVSLMLPPHVKPQGLVVLFLRLPRDLGPSDARQGCLRPALLACFRSTRPSPSCPCCSPPRLLLPVNGLHSAATCHRCLRDEAATCPRRGAPRLRSRAHGPAPSLGSGRLLSAPSRRACPHPLG